jgi:hypothetical protein
MPDKSHLISASEIEWGGSSPPNYPSPVWTRSKVKDMEEKNRNNCSLQDPARCDVVYEGEFYKWGKIKAEYIGKYLDVNDSDLVKEQKRGFNKFRINKGNRYDSPSDLVELIDENHWVVAPCPPLCDGAG